MELAAVLYLKAQAQFYKHQHIMVAQVLNVLKDGYKVSEGGFRAAANAHAHILRALDQRNEWENLLCIMRKISRRQFKVTGTSESMHRNMYCKVMTYIKKKGKKLKQTKPPNDRSQKKEKQKHRSQSIHASINPIPTSPKTNDKGSVKKHKHPPEPEYDLA
jgi:septum formation inhibitor MinC